MHTPELLPFTDTVQQRDIQEHPKRIISHHVELAYRDQDQHLELR